MNLVLVNPFLRETNVFHNHSNYIFGNQSRLIFVFGVLVFCRTWPFIANWPELLGTCMVNPKTLSIIWLLFCFRLQNGRRLMINRAPTRNVCGMVALWRTVIKSSHKLVPGDHQHLRPWSWEIAIITNICRPKSFRLQLTLQENDVWRRPAYIYIYMAEKTDTYDYYLLKFE